MKTYLKKVVLGIMLAWAIKTVALFAYDPMLDKATGDLVIEDEWDKIKTNFDWVSSLTAFGAALSTLPNGSDIGGAAIAVGTYTGNATDNRDIVISPAFTPKTVFVWPGQLLVNLVARWGAAADAAWAIDAASTGAPVAGYIKLLNSDGFRVGTNAVSNGSAVTYYYLAIG